MQKWNRSSILGQVETMCHARFRAAALVSALIGAIVPVTTYFVAHSATNSLAWVLVAGGLLFSAPNVYGWGCTAFGSRAKSLGFVVLLEGTMVLGGVDWLGWVALIYLVLINMAATASRLVTAGLEANKAARKERRK